MLDFGWPDHHAPLMNILCCIVKTMDGWLREVSANSLELFTDVLKMNSVQLLNIILKYMILVITEIITNCKALPWKALPCKALPWKALPAYYQIPLLSQDPDHVIVCHCKGGKGRTGVAIAAYIQYSNMCLSAEDCLDKFAMNR